MFNALSNNTHSSKNADSVCLCILKRKDVGFNSQNSSTSRSIYSSRILNGNDMCKHHPTYAYSKQWVKKRRTGNRLAWFDSKVICEWNISLLTGSLIDLWLKFYSYLSKGLVHKIEVTVKYQKDTRAVVHLLAHDSQSEKERVSQLVFTNESSSAFAKEMGVSVQKRTAPDLLDVYIRIIWI